VGEILADIRRYRPHVTLTFHRRGVSGHPDHIAVACLLDAAIAQAGPEGPHVSYEWGIPRANAPLYQRPNLVPLEEDEIAAVITIDGDAMDRKLQAIRCHRTQYEFFVSLEDKFDYRAMSSPEHFARGPSRLRFDGRPVADLFEGVEDD
jgi:LmbE family N-acetylglucosaminyl deacetylase